jgi:cytidylate kinase
MAVLAISRNIGSGGASIAHALAERMSFRLIDREAVVREAAKQGADLSSLFGAPDMVSALDGRIGPTMAGAELEFGELLFGLDIRRTSGLDLKSGTDQEMDRQAILLALATAHFELAAPGNVIFLDTWADLLLAGGPGVRTIKVVAPVPVRLARLMDRFGLTEEEGRVAIEHTDATQELTAKSCFDANWHDPAAWDLTINTESFAVEQVVDLLEAMLSTSIPDQVAGSEILAAASVINHHLAEAEISSDSWSIAVPRGASSIALIGVVVDEGEHRAVLKIARSSASNFKLVDDLASPRSVASRQT